MKAIIDTNSLLVIARSYTPFDKNGKLHEWLHNLYSKKELIVIDRVYDEAKGLQQGIILDALKFLPFLEKQKKPDGVIVTDEILPNAKFFQSLDAEFCNQAEKRKITEFEFEERKERYVNEADVKMILYAQSLLQGGLLTTERVTIVTEETPYGTDKKCFKKIPAICKLLNIDCCTLTELLRDHYCVNLGELLN